MQHKIELMTAHAEGEVGRVAMADHLDLPGVGPAARLEYINTVDDSLRRTLTLEPRSAPAGSTNLVFSPSRADADAAFIVLQPDQAHAMSGSNSICVVTVLLESGHLPMADGENVVTLETAAGLVVTRAQCEDGKCLRVSLDMTPSYVEELDRVLRIPDLGEVKMDICFGGVFYAIVDVDQVGLVIEPGNAGRLSAIGMQIKSILNATVEVVHPDIPAINGIGYVMFRGPEKDGAIRTCTTLWPGRCDRSPCGTGSSAQLATMHARGLAAPGDEFTTRSIIGSEFGLGFKGLTEVAGRTAVLPRLTGRGWLYGSQTLWVDPSDPFPQGFALSDTFGPLAAEI